VAAGEREVAERAAAAEELKQYNIMRAAAARLRELEARAAAAEDVANAEAAKVDSAKPETPKL
jgi:hypothetical protein